MPSERRRKRQSAKSATPKPRASADPAIRPVFEVGIGLRACPGHHATLRIPPLPGRNFSRIFGRNILGFQERGLKPDVSHAHGAIGKSECALGPSGAERPSGHTAPRPVAGATDLAAPHRPDAHRSGETRYSFAVGEESPAELAIFIDSELESGHFDALPRLATIPPLLSSLADENSGTTTQTKKTQTNVTATIVPIPPRGNDAIWRSDRTSEPAGSSGAASRPVNDVFLLTESIVCGLRHESRIKRASSRTIQARLCRTTFS